MNEGYPYLDKLSVTVSTLGPNQRLTTHATRIRGRGETLGGARSSPCATAFVGRNVSYGAS
jgi:hypothetical protein